MKTCNRNFPGTNRTTSDSYARDVAIDEKAMIDAISELRQKESSSLEAIGYLMGADPAQLSRYLKGTAARCLPIICGRTCARVSKQVGTGKSRRQRCLFRRVSGLRIVTHQVRRTHHHREK